MTAYEKNQNALVIGGFILICTICVSPMLFFGKTLVLRDTFFEFRFLYAFAKENIANGIIPLWNPYSNCGQPFIANPQSALFYPLNWFYYVLEFHQAYTLFIFIHLLLAGVFMYAFIKPIVKNRWISIFGGVIYMLNGLSVSRIEFASEFASIAWIPAILALLRTNILAPSWLSSVLLGLAISVQFLAGHTQSFYQTVLFSLLFLAFLVFIHYIREQKTFAVLNSIKFLIAAGVLALLIAMIQLVPTYELFTLSIRLQTDYDAKTHLASLHPTHLLTLLYPYLFGWPGYKSYWGSTYEFWASSFYVGVIPFVFCLLAVLLSPTVKKNRSGNRPLEYNYFIFFGVCFAIAFLIALGDYSPVFRFFYEYVPGYAKFRWPSSSLLLCTIAMSVIAPMGLQGFLQFTADRAYQPSLWPAVTFGALMACFLAVALVITMSPLVAEKIIEAVSPSPNQSLADFRSFIETIAGASPLSDENHIAKIGHTVWFSTSFILIICIMLWSRFSGKLRTNYLVASVIFFTAVDLIGHGSMGVSFLDKGLNLKQPETIGTTADSLSNQRLMTLTNDYQQYAYGTEDLNTLFLGIDALTGEVGLAQQLFRTKGKGVLRIKNYSEFSGFRGLPHALQLKILKFLNVEHVLHFERSSSKESDVIELKAPVVDQYQKMAALDSRRWSIQLTRLDESLPRIFVVPRFSVMPSETIEQKNIIFRHFLNGSFDFSKTVIVDEPIEGFTMTDDVKFVTHQPASYTNPNQVKAVIETDRDGILVISDVFYPGWELFVNGTKQKIYKANTTFRAGVLKAGVNTILFKYNPKSFKIGFIFTIIGIGITIGLLVVHFRIRNAPLRERSKA